MSSNRKSNGPTNVSKKQLGFLSALYRDIVLEIFSYLTQQDCLTCMAVCRDWYAAVPQYSQNTWKEIQLYTRDASIDHQRQQQCLGSHVKHVVIKSMGDEEDLSSITLMQRLLDRECTQIHSLEYRWADTPDQKSFFDVLKQLAPRLTHLKFHMHKSSTDILALFYVCPELTCFDYSQRGPTTWERSINKNARNDRKLDALSLGVPANFCTKITYLRLDTFITKEDVEHILKKCPQLQCYIGPSAIVSRCIGKAHNYTNIDSIFSSCPKINSLAIMSNYSAIPKRAGDFISKLPGLRYFDIPNGVGKIDETAAWLTKSQSTLEYLNIPSSYHSHDWSPILKSLRMPNLRFLSYANVKSSIPSIISLLNQCPNLQEVALHCLLSSFDLDLVQSLYTMQSLHSLKIKDAVFTDGATFAMFFERIPALKTLHIRKAFLPRELPKHFQSPDRLKYLKIGIVEWTHLENQELDEYEATTYFLRHLTKHTELETVHFDNMTDVNLAVYQELAKIPTLKDLTISLTFDSEDLDDDEQIYNNLYDSSDAYEMEFSQFIHMLRMTSIERLELIDCYNLSAAMFDALAELPLKELSTKMFLEKERCTNVDIQDLLQYLYKSQSLAVITFNSVYGFNYEQLNGAIQSKAFANSVAQTRAGSWKAYDCGISMCYPMYRIKWTDI